MEYFNSKNKIIYQSTIVMIIMGKSKISFKINVKIPNNFGQDLNILNKQSEDLNQIELGNNEILIRDNDYSETDFTVNNICWLSKNIQTPIVFNISLKLDKEKIKKRC
jgi:hypothetical protein